MPKLCGSSIDIYFAALKLCIMIDGEGHFRDHRASTVDQQQSIDHRFNKNALKKGARVLRLHYKDKGIYRQIISVAVHRCCKGTFGRIDFSKSYDAEIRIFWSLQPLQCSSRQQKSRVEICNA